MCAAAADKSGMPIHTARCGGVAAWAFRIQRQIWCPAGVVAPAGCGWLLLARVFQFAQPLANHLAGCGDRNRIVKLDLARIFVRA